MKKLLSAAFWVMLVFYGVLSLDFFFRVFLISSGANGMSSVNLIPMRTIWEYISGQNGVAPTLMIYNTLGNIAIFVPLGLYLRLLLREKPLGLVLLLPLCASVLIEIIQFTFSIGAADIDDVILNTVGGIIGALICERLLGKERDVPRARRVIAIASLIVGLPMMLFYLAICARRILGL